MQSGGLGQSIHWIHWVVCSHSLVCLSSANTKPFVALASPFQISEHWGNSTTSICLRQYQKISKKPLLAVIYIFQNFPELFKILSRQVLRNSKFDSLSTSSLPPSKLKNILIIFFGGGRGRKSKCFIVTAQMKNSQPNDKQINNLF